MTIFNVWNLVYNFNAAELSRTIELVVHIALTVFHYVLIIPLSPNLAARGFVRGDMQH
jgi:hypothetical protein